MATRRGTLYKRRPIRGPTWMHTWGTILRSIPVKWWLVIVSLVVVVMRSISWVKPWEPGPISLPTPKVSSVIETSSPPTSEILLRWRILSSLRELSTSILKPLSR